MLEALEDVCEYISDAEEQLSPLEAARRFVEAVCHPHNTSFPLPSGVLRAIANTVSPLSHWIRDTRLLHDIRDIDLESLLKQILSLARVVFEHSESSLPMSVETTLRRNLFEVASDVIANQGPDFDARTMRPLVEDGDLERFVETLQRRLPKGLLSMPDAVRLARRACERRTPVHLDPAMNLVEHLIRTVQQDRGITFRDPPRRLQYSPEVAPRVGDIVLHPKFGEGTVLDLLNGKAAIRFGDTIRQLVCSTRGR